jgi:hypothetical protein
MTDLRAASIGGGNTRRGLASLDPEDVSAMGDWLKSMGRRLRTAWVWPLALLALPNCILDTGSYGPPPVFKGGPEPRTGVIMCDIPRVSSSVEGTNCATPTEAEVGLPLARAAVALAQGESQSLALDFSADAIAACGGPQKIEFYGPFPDGYAVCLNCGTQIPVPYANSVAACVAQCIDLLNHDPDGIEPQGSVEAYCQANARLSTHFESSTCWPDACTSAGTLKPDFVDPRRTQEPVKWIDHIGTSASGNTLTRIAPTTTGFDAGAASAQTITHGDGWVEFEAGENTFGHILGFSPDVGPDTDPTELNIGFAIRLKSNGEITIHEGAVEVTASLGSYVAGDRFRVRLTDNHDGTATISYTRLNGACTPGTICDETVLATQTNPGPSYPLRVDASLGAEGSSLANVTLVRIR